MLSLIIIYYKMSFKRFTITSIETKLFNVYRKMWKHKRSGRNVILLKQIISLEEWPQFHIFWEETTRAWRNPRQKIPQSGEKQENTFTHHNGCSLKGGGTANFSTEDFKSIKKLVISHIEKDKYCIVSFLREFKINKKNRLMESENKLMVARGKTGLEQMDEVVKESKGTSFQS